MQRFTIRLAAVLFAAAACGSFAAEPDEASISACYAAAKDEAARGRCLESELKLVLARHKDVVERVTIVAKAWDKPYRTKLRWDKFIRSGQSFDTFVRRECDFVRYTTKGSRQVEKNAELACRIGYYRVHADILRNRYLAGNEE